MASTAVLKAKRRFKPPSGSTNSLPDEGDSGARTSSCRITNGPIEAFVTWIDVPSRLRPTPGAMESTERPVTESNGLGICMFTPTLAPPATNVTSAWPTTGKSNRRIGLPPVPAFSRWSNVLGPVSRSQVTASLARTIEPAFSTTPLSALMVCLAVSIVTFVFLPSVANVMPLTLTSPTVSKRLPPRLFQQPLETVATTSFLIVLGSVVQPAPVPPGFLVGVTPPAGIAAALTFPAELPSHTTKPPWSGAVAAFRLKAGALVTRIPVLEKAPPFGAPRA